MTANASVTSPEVMLPGVATAKQRHQADRLALKFRSMAPDQQARLYTELGALQHWTIESLGRHTTAVKRARVAIQRQEEHLSGLRRAHQCAVEQQFGRAAVSHYAQQIEGAQRELEQLEKVEWAAQRSDFGAYWEVQRRRDEINRTNELRLEAIERSIAQLTRGQRAALEACLAQQIAEDERLKKQTESRAWHAQHDDAPLWLQHHRADVLNARRRQEVALDALARSTGRRPDSSGAQAARLVIERSAIAAGYELGMAEARLRAAETARSAMRDVLDIRLTVRRELQARLSEHRTDERAAALPAHDEHARSLRPSIPSPDERERRGARSTLQEARENVASTPAVYAGDPTYRVELEQAEKTRDGAELRDGQRFAQEQTSKLGAPARELSRRGIEQQEPLARVSSPRAAERSHDLEHNAEARMEHVRRAIERLNRTVPTPLRIAATDDFNRALTYCGRVRFGELAVAVCRNQRGEHIAFDGARLRDQAMRKGDAVSITADYRVKTPSQTQHRARSR